MSVVLSRVFDSVRSPPSVVRVLLTDRLLIFY